MTALGELVRGQVAAILARHGRPVTLARRTAGFDVAAQALAAGSVACTVPGLVLRRAGRGAEVQVHLAQSALAASGFPGQPLPGDILTLDGLDGAVIAVESFDVGSQAAFHLLRVER
ncbi:hypothetical protein STAQ_11600 [Allostella sp. ATCC 35155]|nr:hypothetical protein STAQ_11600 [Stella sp. ATCC 35155]